MQNTKIEIYTDGSCLGNPGPGGWGVLILGKNNIQLSGGEKQTTNNRMEMTAIIKALEWLHNKSGLTKEQLRSVRILIHSDSNLLISTLNLGWKRKANLDLWAQIDKLRAWLPVGKTWLNINWVWVKAHATNKHNNQVDKLALAAATKAKKALPKQD